MTWLEMSRVRERAGGGRDWENTMSPMGYSGGSGNKADMNQSTGIRDGNKSILTLRLGAAYAYETFVLRTKSHDVTIQ